MELHVATHFSCGGHGREEGFEMTTVKPPQYPRSFVDVFSFKPRALAMAPSLLWALAKGADSAPSLEGQLRSASHHRTFNQCCHSDWLAWTPLPVRRLWRSAADGGSGLVIHSGGFWVL